MTGEAPGMRSLGMRTEVAVAKRGCQLTRRDGYWVMRTPDNPHYFQSVATDRDHRRQGICGTLVHEVCTRALRQRPGRRLVMCAFEHYHATHLYQSLGFQITERHVDYLRRPPVA